MLLQAAILVFEFGDVERAIDKQLERVGVDGFFVKVVSTLRDRRQRVFLVAVARHDDHFGVRREFENFAERQEPLFDAFGLGRQTQVLQNHHGFMATQLGDRRLTVLGSKYVVAFEAPLELTQQPRVILND